jgi:hypothetical protein
VSECHFLGYLKKKLTVSVVRLAQQSAKLVEVTRLFTNTAPCNVIRRFSLGEVRQFQRFLAFAKQLTERALKSSRNLLQRLDGGNGTAIFNAGNVAAKQTCAVLNVALREFLLLAHSADAVANNHGPLLQPVERASNRMVRGSGGKKNLFAACYMHIVSFEDFPTRSCGATEWQGWRRRGREGPVASVACCKKDQQCLLSSSALSPKPIDQVLSCAAPRGSLPAFAFGDVVDRTDATDICSITEQPSLSPRSPTRTAIDPPYG